MSSAGSLKEDLSSAIGLSGSDRYAFPSFLESLAALELLFLDAILEDNYFPFKTKIFSVGLNNLNGRIDVCFQLQLEGRIYK